MNEGIVLKQEKKFIIRDFPEKRLLEINGIRYAYTIFECLGFDDPGTIFRIDERNKGVITISRITNNFTDYLNKNPKVMKAIRESGFDDFMELWKE